MEEQKPNQSFQYSYSARQKSEVERIRSRYLPDEEGDKLARVRALDASVSRHGTVAGVIVGIVGALLMGTGMSLAMTDFGSFLAEPVKMAVGVIVGVVGIGVCALAYPVYQRVSARRRTRVSEEILKLTEELLKK